MARVKNPTLSTLTPDQLKFWQGLRSAEYIAPGEKTFKLRGGRKSKRANRFTSHTPMAEPDAPIAQLALNAAQWLVEHHPKKVREQGRDAFITARVNEILQHQFPAPYWEPCPLLNETTRKSVPVCDTFVIQPPIKFQTPGSMNTKCEYDTSTPDSGPAGFLGETDEDGYFRDKWLKEKQFLFTVPAPQWQMGTRPLFSKHSASWQVHHKHRNAQPWCTLYKASTANNEAALTDRAQSVDKIGRYFFWHYATPVPAVGGSLETMARSFVVDARYLGHDYNSTPDTAGVCLIQIAPASARGRYRYFNNTISTTMVNACELFVARAEDEHDPLCCPFPPTLQSWAVTTNPCNTQDYFGGVGAPCYSIWYYNKLARADYNGVKRPASHPFHFVESVPLRGGVGNQAYGKHITAEIIPRSRNTSLGAPRPSDPLIQVLCHGPTGQIQQSGTFLFCSNGESGPCVGNYAGWGYRAYDGCQKKWVVHVFPGSPPTALAFNAAWTAGKYPL